MELLRRLLWQVFFEHSKDKQSRLGTHCLDMLQGVRGNAALFSLQPQERTTQKQHAERCTWHDMPTSDQPGSCLMQKGHAFQPATIKHTGIALLSERFSSNRHTPPEIRRTSSLPSASNASPPPSPTDSYERSLSQAAECKRTSRTPRHFAFYFLPTGQRDRTQ